MRAYVGMGMLKSFALILYLFIGSLLMGDDYCQALRHYKSEAFADAKLLLDPMAFKGNTKAQNLLGLVNLEEQNNAAAQKWLQSAAVKGDEKAAYNLGVYYYALAQNSKALRWMHKAEKLTEAKLALGFLYLQKNERKAKEYFFEAAGEGNSFAQSHLCAVLAKKKSSIDQKYKDQCQGKEVRASYEMGRFYTSPKKYGSTQKAVYYLQYAADMGHAGAMNLLGEMLYKRNGPMDQDKAMQYFLKAADKGNVDAKVNAAWLYYTGQRWTRDAKKGKAILDKALAKQHPKAQYYMGVLCMRGMAFSGETVKKDVNKGLAYIKSAASKNDPEALAYLIKYYRSGDEVQRYKRQLQRHERAEQRAKSLTFLYEGC